VGPGGGQWFLDFRFQASVAIGCGRTWIDVVGDAVYRCDSHGRAREPRCGGAGPLLIVAGDFEQAGGLQVGNIASWDGSEWAGLGDHTGTGLSAAGLALAEYDDGGGPALYAGGDFNMAGGVPSSRIAEWSCQAGFLFADGFESGDTEQWSVSVP